MASKFLVTARFTMDDIPVQLVDSREDAQDVVNRLTKHREQFISTVTAACDAMDSDASMFCCLAIVEFGPFGTVRSFNTVNIEFKFRESDRFIDANE